MPKFAHFKQNWKWYAFVGLIFGTLALMFSTGFLSDMLMGAIARSGLPGAISGSAAPLDGESSLEERIAGAEIIARVKLRSVTQVAEHYGYKDKAYGVALEFSFDVIEYLKGNGSSTLVAVAYDMDVPFRTKLGASLFGEDLLAERDMSWDDREAIIFLADDHPSLPSSKKADRYWFWGVKVWWHRTLHHSQQVLQTLAARSGSQWNR